jgi:hypothetical protein
MALKTKSPRERGDYYVDGLVSTGNRNSLHNIKYNFFYIKKFFGKNYSHLRYLLWKRMVVVPLHLLKGSMVITAFVNEKSVVPIVDEGLCPTLFTKGKTYWKPDKGQ